MKVLFINLPYYGHVIPTIGLVQELIQLGSEVTYMLPYDWEHQIEGSGAKFYGYNNHRQLSEQIKNAYVAAKKIIESFDLVIYEQFFFLGKHLAEKYQKPVVRIFTAPATTKQLMNEYISSKGPLSIFKYHWIAKAFTKDIAKNIKLKTDNWLDEIVENPPELNLVYTLQDYQPYVDEFPSHQFYFLGPSIYDRKEKPMDLQKGKNPLVYISLGTIVKGGTQFFQTCMEVFRNEDIDVIISVGQKFDIKKLKNIPNNIHLYPRVPQIEALKMADLFITHGGMNSVSEALVFSTPMIVIPFSSDQPINATCVEKLGVGKQLNYANINQHILKETVFSILENKEITNNYQKVQEMIKEAPGNSGGAKLIMDYYHSK